MSFREFFYSIPVPERPAFAARVESTVGYLTLLAGGFKNCGEALAMRIERESGGAVKVEVLCPDADWSVVRAGTSPAIAAEPLRSLRGDEADRRHVTDRRDSDQVEAA